MGNFAAKQISFESSAQGYLTVVTGRCGKREPRLGTGRKRGKKLARVAVFFVSF